MLVFIQATWVQFLQEIKILPHTTAHCCLTEVMITYWKILEINCMKYIQMELDTNKNKTQTLGYPAQGQGMEYFLQ